MQKRVNEPVVESTGASPSSWSEGRMENCRKLQTVTVSVSDCAALQESEIWNGGREKVRKAEKVHFQVAGLQLAGAEAIGV